MLTNATLMANKVVATGLSLYEWGRKIHNRLPHRVHVREDL